MPVHLVSHSFIYSTLIFQHLKAKVDCEVMDFMKYLQDVAQYCADDYNVISPGAMQYSEVSGTI